MESENEIKILEDKLNNIYSICLRAGISISSKGGLNVFVLLIASIYLDYGYTDLKTILKKISEVCNLEMSEIEDIFRFYEQLEEVDYNDFMNTIISLKDINRFNFNYYILSNRYYYETSESLGRFASNLLGQIPDAKLLDAYSGNGYFDCDYLKLNKSAKIDGYEINPQSVCVAKAINYIFNSQFSFFDKGEYKNCNFIESDFLTEKLKENYYDLAFADCPIGLRYDRSKISNIELATKFVKNNMISIPWLTALKIENSLKENGKAVIVCSRGSLFGIVDREVRKYFVDKNLISRIIELPCNLNLYSSIKLFLIVIEKGKKNKSIKFSNVSDCITKERRVNILNVKEALDEVANNSIEVSLETIQKNNYTLDVNRYINNNKINIEYGITLEKVAERIFRGYQFTASQVDKMYTNNEKEANYKILEVSNIDNMGNIDNNLKLINSGDKDLSKHLLQIGDVILSSKGTNTKIAVINKIKDGEKIIPSGSLIVIRLDKNKMNPTYLKAFFESEIGQLILGSIKTGITIPAITPGVLAMVEVKCPNIQEQEEFVDKYKMKYELYKITEEKMNKYLKELKALTDQI